MACERKVVQAGYLIKSPPQEKLMAQWHRRYFVLLSSKVMEYYSSHECKPQDYLKSINLSQCEDMVAPLPIHGRLYIIKLSIKTGPKLRNYFLDCSNEENMSSWIMSLAQTCGFCPVDSEVDEEDDEFYSSANFTNQMDKSIAGSTLKQTWNNSYSEQFYDDMGINVGTIYAMNKNPPPIWRPKVPLFPTKTKVQRSAESDKTAMDTHLIKSPIVPIGSSSQTLRGSDIFSLKNDPKFLQKLQEKREELYSDGVTVLRDRSMSDVVPQERYDSIDSDVWSGLNLQDLEDNPVDYLNFKSVNSGSAPQIQPKTMSMMRNATNWNYKSHFQQAIPIPQQKVHGLSSSLVQRDVASPLPSQECLHRPLTVSSSQGLSISPHEEPIRPPIREKMECSPFPNPMYPLSYEDTPPPIPVRITSNQFSSSSTSGSSSSPVQEVLGKQRVNPRVRRSSSLTDSHISEQQPLPPHHHNSHQTESSSFTAILARVFSSSPKHQSKDNSISFGLTGREPAPVPQDELSTDDYDDIEYTGGQVESSSNYPDPTNLPDYDPSFVQEELYDDVVFNSVQQQDEQQLPRSPPRERRLPHSPPREQRLPPSPPRKRHSPPCERRLPHSPPHERRLPPSPPRKRHSPPCERRLPHSPPRERRLPHSPPRERRLPHSPPREQWLSPFPPHKRHSPPCEQQLPSSPPRERRLPQSPPHERRLPHSPPRERRLPSSPPREQRLSHSPPREQRLPPSPPRKRQLLHSPPPPDMQDIQPNKPERKSSLESHLQTSLSRVNRADSCPPIPPDKTKIPRPPVKPRRSKPALTEKQPVVEKKTSLTKKPSSMAKPPVAKKTAKVSEVKQVEMPAKKEGPPPTQPKPSKNASASSPISSASSSNHQEQVTTIPPPAKHKPKPPRVHEKPLQVPLFS